MKINLFSFSHAKCSGSIRKLVCCADGVRKISPLQGDGNNSIHIMITSDVSRKEDKSPARGRKQMPERLMKKSMCKEDKSPARGRKQTRNLIIMSPLHRKEDKSPARGRKL